MINTSRSILRVERLIRDFAVYVSSFENSPAFNKFGQKELHVETIRLRLECGSVAAALESERFLDVLYKTLGAWGIGSRASSLVSFDQFSSQFQRMRDDLVSLESLKIDSLPMSSTLVASRIWKSIKSLSIVNNNAVIVSGTKALHHVLPDLIVPVDRAYTQKFFGWHSPEFQYNQGDAFRASFEAFAAIARAADPRRYVTTGWNSSVTKVIDNAIVAYVRDEGLGAAS